jgi:prepilin-type N-terminal cleavage/methylation domain-containing protein
MGSFRSGFTLIELLIVVAIISVLAAIAVPNFLEAQTRSKVARIKADQRTVATALEAYAVDNNKYPVRQDKWDTPGTSKQMAPPFKEKIYDPDLPAAAVGMHTLTTPIVYISSLPGDIFNMPARALAQPGTPYSDAIDFWDPQQADAWLAVLNGIFRGGQARGWMLISVGPDQHLGLTTAGQPGDYPPETLATAFSSRLIYDPTNGTISTGNIYRFAGDLSQKDINWRF